jgi:hypothetical protein
MTEFVKENEPRLLSFNTYLNEDRSEASTVMLHPDSESLEYHLEVARTRIKGGVEMVRVKRAELYGKPSDRLVAQLRQMSEASGSWPVIVKSYLQGFSNLTDR